MKYWFDFSEIDLGTKVVVEMDETQTWLSHPTAKDRQVDVIFSSKLTLNLFTFVGELSSVLKIVLGF